jgi:glycosyltransferase involved in cell wall biosynthesis
MENSGAGGVSVVIPALNEEKTLGAAVATILKAAKSAGDVPVEIIIVNDGSTDSTAEVIEKLKKEHPRVRSVDHGANRGFGAAFLSGLGAAGYPWIALFPGDNAVSSEMFSGMLRNAGKADLILAFTMNIEARSRPRNFLSGIFSFIYTATFNIPLRYINSTPVYPVGRLRELPLRCQRYSFPAEPTIKLLRQGCSFMEIPGYINPGATKSSALRVRNLLEVAKCYLLLVYEIYFLSREKYARAPVRVRG